MVDSIDEQQILQQLLAKRIKQQLLAQRIQSVIIFPIVIEFFAEHVQQIVFEQIFGFILFAFVQV